jgi:YqaJ-like viral recombinase domain
MEQGTAEWKALRAGKATASMFADAIAFKKDGTEMAVRRDYRTQLVVERLTGKEYGGFTTFAMREGIEREPLARTHFEAITGHYVQQIAFIEHPELLAGCSPDGLIGDHAGVEIKCPQPPKHFEYLSLAPGAAPAEYMPQVQGALWLTGRPSWYFVSFNPDFPEPLRLVVRHVQRDEKYIQALDVGLRQFLDEVDRDYVTALNFTGAIHV